MDMISVLGRMAFCLDFPGRVVGAWFVQLRGRDLL